MCARNIHLLSNFPSGTSTQRAFVALFILTRCCKHVEFDVAAVDNIVYFDHY